MLLALSLRAHVLVSVSTAVVAARGAQDGGELRLEQQRSIHPSILRLR